MLALVAIIAVAVLAQAPVSWSTNVTIFYEAGAAGVLSSDVVTIPYLEASNLWVDVLNPVANMSFSLCLKLGVGMPATSSKASWASQCALFSFSAPAGAAEKRAVFSSSALRGAGSEARVGAAAAAARSTMSVLERRALVGNWSAAALVRMGSYFVTISADTPPTANTTLTLRLSGKTCATGYGPACDTATPITAGGAHSVAVPALTTHMFTFDGSVINGSTSALQLTVSKVGNTTGTAWLRWAAPPVDTPGGYDLAVPLDADTATTTASIPTPRQGVWFLAIADTSNASVLIVNVTLAAPTCDAGFLGADCKTQPVTLGAAGAVSDHTDMGNGAQLYVAFGAKSALAIAAASDDSTTAPQLYAKLGGLPTATDYDFAGCNVAGCSGGQATLVAAANDSTPTLQEQQWYALVVASADGGVSVWNATGCASDCSGQGQCNFATSTCTCTDDFSGFDCSASKNALERWEWALIIGGGVLVAICLIGCIVYFIQKQQRRRGFERV